MCSVLNWQGRQRTKKLGLCTVAVFTAYTAVLDTAVTVAVLHRQG
jgi:TRAP-type mannitol/chloroaromatic compound transport system substrate-binding protein